MAFKRIGILHISDLHFLDQKKDSERKELPASEKFIKEINSLDPKELFLNKIKLLLSGQKVDAIAFTGDAGFGEDTALMEQGINYLSKLKDRFNLTAEYVIVSPGNHDLNRTDAKDEEFSRFIKKCKSEGFQVATREDPAKIEVEGIPVIAINTCLGGTERAYHGLPDEFWKSVRGLIESLKNIEGKTLPEIPPDLKDQFQPKDMDIPALGHCQIMSIQNSLSSSHGNCAVLLGHHNLLPTQRIVIRPFADIIDSGRIIFNLISDGKKILFLHGHTHCDTALTARSPEEDEHGFIVCLGANGLHTIHSGSLASASYIQLIVDDSCNFLCAVVTRIQQKGSDFFKAKTFPIYDDTIIATEPPLPIDKMVPQKIYNITQVAELFDRSDEDELASQLLKYRNCHPIDINDVNKPIKDWALVRKA